MSNGKFEENLLSRGVVLALYNSKAAGIHGYDSLTTAALTEMTGALEQYLTGIAALCSEASELSGRTLITLHDLMIALSHYGINVEELKAFYSIVDNVEVPKADMDVSSTVQAMDLVQESFGSIRQDKKQVPPEFDELMKDDQPESFGPFVPSHMPPFPAKHSYKRSAIFQHREKDPIKMRELYRKQSRIVQENLKSLIHKKDKTVVDILPSVTKSTEVAAMNSDNLGHGAKRKYPEDENIDVMPEGHSGKILEFELDLFLCLNMSFCTYGSLPPIPVITKLSQRIIRVLGMNPGPFTLQSTNTYIIGTGKTRILLDTGQGTSEYLQLLKKVVNDEGIEVLDPVLLTHKHHDHVGGIKDIQELFKGKQVGFHITDPVGAAFEGFKGISDGQKFEVEGATLQAIHTSGHTLDHCCFLLEEEGCLFSGDSVLGDGSSTVFEDLSSYMSGLNKLRQFGDQIRMICPAHGNTIDNPLNKIDEYISHRMEREQQIVQLLKSKGPLNIKDIVSILYAQYPQNVHAAAEKSVLHHLKKLSKDGKVTEAQEDGRYSLC